MNQNPLVLSRWTDTELSGSITADAAGDMYTSIPYDKGWSILVDGKMCIRDRLLSDRGL